MNAPEVVDHEVAMPVTVFLNPAQAAQFEALLAQRREESPWMDESKLASAIFTRGMRALGFRDESGDQAEISHDTEVATAAYIAELLERIAVLEAPRPISTPQCIRHLQDLMVGAGACLAIDGEDVLVEVVMEPAGESINVQPEELVELVDALTVIQNLREEQ